MIHGPAMTADRENPIVRVIRRAARNESAGLTDCELLGRYSAEGDSTASEALLHRYGGTVWRVCRAVLGDSPAAEDAFQATFLVLVRRAGSIRRPELLAHWLHGVAHRIACRAWKTHARSLRLTEVDAMATARPDTRVDDRDSHRVLHDELQRLPVKYAAPLVLCYLEGRTTEEAAEQLQCPVGTVKVHLMRGREMLKGRLTRRGVTAAVAGTVLIPATSNAVPIRLIEATLHSAATHAAGGAVEPLTQHLLRGELLAMTGKRLLLPFAVSLIACVVGGFGYFALAGPNGSTFPPVFHKAPAVKTDREALQGTWNVSTLESDGIKIADQMVQGSKIVLKGNAFTTASMGSTYEGAYTLDPDKSPKTIDMTFTKGPEKGNTALGIYKLDGDTWTICLTVTAKERPTKFEAKLGSGLALETLKRSTGDDPKPAAKPDQTKVAPPADKKAAEELKRFAGEWEMVSGEMSGQAMPAVMSKTMKRIVKDGENTVTMGGQVYFKATLTVDPSKTPRTIDYAMTEGPTKGKTQLGIYEWEDGTLRFIFASPGQDRPKDFTTKANDGKTLSVWKRVKP
ncbi:MAG TPA: sigma-70 family RNA polymerase sigma factor [Fimbriiglobus sp.]|jgi:RNA polymerase sigma-70 factor (ECF subfamily)